MENRFNWKKILFVFQIFFIVINIQTVFSLAANNPNIDQFPKPKELEPAVNFWIKIYTRYNTNEYVIHDSRNLSIIYEIVRFGTAGEARVDLPQTRTQRNTLKKKQSHYKAILQKLASSKTNFDKLKEDEQKVFEIFSKTKKRSVYRTASQNVRTQKGQRNRFLNGMRISGRYMTYIKDIFNEHGLPQELTVMPHVESSFNYRAYSSVGAAGLWQFTRSTGRRFMKINYEIDERLDPLLATEAAAKLLKANFEELGTWPMAITAYNSGTAGMKRAKRNLKTSNIATIIAKYRSRYFKFASRNFYCEFLAALQIVQNYRDYFGEIQYDVPIQYQEFELPHYVKFSTLAQYFQIDKEELKKYNPAFRDPIFSGSKYLPKNYKIKIPQSVKPDVLYAQIPSKQLFVAQKRSQWYRVRRGDTLGNIARRNQTSINSLMVMNNIRNKHRIRVGEVLRLPDETKLKAITAKPEPVIASAEPEKLPPKNELKTKEVTKEVVVTAQPETEPPSKVVLSDEETSKTNVEESSKIEIAPIKVSDFVGPKIDVTVPKLQPNSSLNSEIELVENSKPQVGYILIELEETLGHYAEWMNVATQQIRNWNNISYGTNIRVGQKLKLVFQTISPEDFNENRLEYHRGIEEDFFNNYQVVNTSIHKVESGENIWYLCNYVYKLPYWLVRSYNGDLNLENLKPGDLIVVPEVTETTPSS